MAATEGGGGKKRGRGGEPKDGGDGGLVHENCIVAVRLLPAADAAGGVARFLTAGLDGRMVEWEVER